MSFRRGAIRTLPPAALMAFLVACAATAAAPGATGETVPGVGVLPSALGPKDTEVGTTVASVVTYRTVPLDLPPTTKPAGGTVGGRAGGNRVLLIGDSIMASTSKRYSNDMCNALVPLGWQVEVDAETSRFIDFGKKVLDKRMAAGFDVGVVLLGNNYGKNQAVFSALLEDMVVRMSSMPVVLLTVTEFEPSRAEVNQVIQNIALLHDNVTVLDWATASKATGGLLGDDGLHLTPLGRAALAYNVAGTLGSAPRQPGQCLSTNYRDDSGGPVNGTTAPKQATPKPTPTPPRPRGTTPSTFGAPTVTTSRGSGSTVPPTGAPPTVAPPTVAPPTTPPRTTPPTAAPPPIATPPAAGPPPITA